MGIGRNQPQGPGEKLNPLGRLPRHKGDGVLSDGHSSRYVTNLHVVVEGASQVIQRLMVLVPFERGGLGTAQAEEQGRRDIVHWMLSFFSRQPSLKLNQRLVPGVGGQGPALRPTMNSSPAFQGQAPAQPGRSGRPTRRRGPQRRRRTALP